MVVVEGYILQLPMSLMPLSAKLMIEYEIKTLSLHTH